MKVTIGFQLAFFICAVVGGALLGRAEVSVGAPAASAEAIAAFSGAKDHAFDSFYCRYSVRFFILPGFSEWQRSVAPPGSVVEEPLVDKDGVNRSYEIELKKSGGKFFARVADVAGASTSAVSEYHFDGRMFWSYSETGRYATILSSPPNIPVFFDDLLLRFPNSQGDYSEFMKPSLVALHDLLGGDGREVTMKDLPSGDLELRIVEENPKHPFPGMGLLRRFVFAREPDFGLTDYSFAGHYSGEDRKHDFQPLVSVNFSEFRSVAGMQVRIPHRIEVVDTRSAGTSGIQSAEELVSHDRTHTRIPITRMIVELEEIVFDPSFERGELDFYFPPGTEIWDMYANRVYLIGDTLEILREEIAPKDGIK
jgi:hypothetical protein